MAQVHKQIKSKNNYIKYLKLAKEYCDTFSGDIESLEEEINNTQK